MWFTVYTKKPDHRPTFYASWENDLRTAHTKARETFDQSMVLAEDYQRQYQCDRADAIIELFNTI